MTEYTEITERSKAIMRDMKVTSIDQCKNCTLRGDIKACEAIECSNHDNWYTQQLKAEVDQLRVKAEAFDVAEKEIEIMLDIGGEAQFDAGLRYALDALNNAIGSD